MKIIPILIVMLILSNTAIFAQGVKMPVLSPTQTLQQDFSLSEVSITYSRPSARGRVVFGQVVPFGQVWRTGANSSTKINFGEDVKISDQILKAGEYALYTIPDKTEWTIVISKNTQLWGNFGYTDKDDIFRFKVKTQVLNDKVETFTINLINQTIKSFDVLLTWENTAVSFSVSTAIDQDAAIMKELNEAMASDMKPYFQAASYYFQTNRDLNKASEWVNEAVKAQPDAYWIEQLKAQIQLKQKDYKNALISAEIAKAKATKANNPESVKNIEKLISEIKAAK